MVIGFADLGYIDRYIVMGDTDMPTPVIMLDHRSTVPLHTLVKKSLMNQENAYLKGCEVRYLLKSKTSIVLVEFNSQSPFQMRSVFLVTLNNLVYHQRELPLQVNQ